MDVTTETVAPREVEFTIHPEAEQVADAMRRAARKLSQRVRISGFRPGKAPYALVERTVGKEVLTEEAAEILAPEIYKKVIEEGGYQPYDRPTLRVAEQEPLELKIRVPLEPAVTLGDYCAMRIEPEPPVEVAEEQVDKLLQELREQNGTWVPAERPAQLGDQVTVDIEGSAGGEPVFDETGTTIVLSEALAPKGFGEALVGMSSGEAHEFSLTYPEDHPQEGLAGKTVAFAVTMHEVKERKLPALDDDFARSMGDYESLDALRERLRDGLRAEMEADARDRLATHALDELVEQSTIEYPSLALEREIDHLVQRQESRLRQQGFTLDGFLRVTHKTLPQLREELRPQAEKNLRRSLVLGELGKAEKLEVSAEEVGAEVERVASAYGEQAGAVRAALTQAGPLSSLMGDVFSRKAIQRLVDIATGQVPCAAQAPAAEASPEAQPGAEPPAEPPAE
ncbi:MAG TPA: trigger factor [Anaerolineae bacterium]|nr:trigger factor [Anaerolineae bacterium]